MSIDSKLRKWQAAGLIDDATRQRIQDFERGSDRPVLLYALGAIGALTIGTGIIAIVAANWSQIGRDTKIGADLFVGVLLSLAIYLSAVRRDSQARQGDGWMTEVLVGIHYLYVLASLSLIGQVYQLGSPLHHGLLAWSLSTIPLMLLVRTPLLGMVWLAGLAWTEIGTVVSYLTRLDKLGYDSRFVGNLALVVTTGLTLGHIWLARLRWFVRERPAVSAVWTSTLWTALVVGGMVSCFAFYVHIDGGESLTWSVLLVGLMMAAFARALPSLYSDVPPRAVAGMRLLLLASWLALALGATWPHGYLGPIGALAQLAIMAIAAWTTLQLGRLRLFNRLTGLIALRVLFIYFEVFGSMLGTGVGLISSGVVTLLLAWLWKRKTAELAARLAPEETSHVA